MSFFMKSPILRNRTLLAVSLTVFAAYTGIGMVGPVRVLYAQAHGASLAIIGAMASSYLISNFLFQYPVGWLADRWGRKPVTAGREARTGVGSDFPRCPNHWTVACASRRFSPTPGLS